MAKTGRPKKYNNLTLMNVFVEKEDLKILKVAVEIYNEKHKLGGAYSLSILVRDLISTHSKRVKNSKEFIEFNQKIIEEIHQDEVQEVEKIHQEEVKKDDDIEAMLEKIRQEELLLATNNKGEN